MRTGLDVASMDPAEREQPPSEEQLAEIAKLARMRGEAICYPATRAEAEVEVARLWAC
jgi:hypothetical protein